ncbi:hypothetical protein ONZ45_g15028 [Pleurotus djamor]|nr:hypothetical protein ONZ45_g15028 [Pleurotus djamor]
MSDNATANPNPTVGEPSNNESASNDAAGEQRFFDIEKSNTLEQIITRFKVAEITRAEAGRLLYQTIDSYNDIPEHIRDSTVIQFLERIHSHYDSVLQASKRGRTLSGNGSGGHEDEEEESGREVGESGDRGDDEAEEVDLDGKDGSLSEGRSNKKPRVLEADLPWFKSSQQCFVDPHVRRTLNILQVFSDDPKFAKRSLLNTIGIPSFPESQWDAIIRGQMVDLDVVLSSQYALRPISEQVERIGEHIEIKNGTFELARRVTTSSEWVAVWYDTSRAYVCCFPHREKELHDYGQKIHRLFTAKRTDFHSRIIAFDKAFRARLVRERLLQFTDQPLFEEIKQAVLEPSGVEFAGQPSRSHSASQQFQREPCNRFNKDVLDTGLTSARKEELFLLGRQPKFLRHNIWLSEGVQTKISAAEWTLDASPLPTPPLNVMSNSESNETVQKYPDLFKIVTPINVERFRDLLSNHPNQPFVQSVCDGLIHGFWPFAEISDSYPSTFDCSESHPKQSEEETQFLREQVQNEINLQRFSKPFGSTLLPGMYNMPVFAVPKPGSSKFRMVTNQSKGEFSLNSMISHEKIAGLPLDNLENLGSILLRLRSLHPDKKIILYKSDVTSAYRLIPMHPLWQIKQVNKLDGKLMIDRCNAFGGRASMNLWISFAALVTWIAVHERNIPDVLMYVDDDFSWDFDGRTMLYKPYNLNMPMNQVGLLSLWDELGIPHKLEKQVSGSSLTIIGFEVDANGLTITMTPERKSDLLIALRNFAHYPLIHGKRKQKISMGDLSKLAGWVNWALNVYPLLRPGLCHIYSKMSGIFIPSLKVHVNNDMRREVDWMITHLEKSDGVRILKSLDWDVDSASVVLYTDASLVRMAFWSPQCHEGFVCDNLAGNEGASINVWETLAVVSALHHISERYPNAERVVIYSDSTFVINMFNSLKCPLPYSRMLRSAVDVIIARDFQLRVLYIPTEKNVVADALSRGNFLKALASDSSLVVNLFQPPRNGLWSDCYGNVQLRWGLH